MRTLHLIPVAIAAAAAAACGGDTCAVDTSYDPAIVPADFVAEVDHPLYPLPTGARWVYQAGDERVVVEVLSERRTILGVAAVIVHDQGSVAGELIEDTFDWLAQDRAGNVWYMGEATQELDHGRVVSTEGSWEAGVDGAKPGILIPAAPAVGQPYRQEYSPCNAEDMGEVLATDASATVPTGSYTGCLKTRDFTPLEPAVDEEKYYCPGIGLVLTVDVGAGGAREELVEHTP